MRTLLASACLSAVCPFVAMPQLAAEDFDLELGGEVYELRVDLGFAVLADDIVSGTANVQVGAGSQQVNLSNEEWDMAIELSGIWGNRVPFHGSERGWYLYWGLGPTIPYQTYSENNTDANYYALMGRYYLGLGYEFTRSFRLQVLPFVAGGVAVYDLSAGNSSDSDFSTTGQFGAKAEVLFGNRGLTFGGGLSALMHYSSHDLQFTGVNYAIDMEQDYAQLHVSLGYEF